MIRGQELENAFEARRLSPPGKYRDVFFQNPLEIIPIPRAPNSLGFRPQLRKTPGSNDSRVIGAGVRAVDGVGGIELGHEGHKILFRADQLALAETA